MTLQEFMFHFEDPKERDFQRGNGFVSRCPACDSKSLHLSVMEGEDGWLHIHCQKGHTEDEILSAVGLTTEDRKASDVDESMRPPKPASVDYKYTDIHGKVLYVKNRYYIWKNGKYTKIFSMRCPDGERIASLGRGQHTIYNYPAVAAQIARRGRVWIHEGEKASDAFNALGEVSTCQNTGATEYGLTPVGIGMLSGAVDIAIIADRDQVGEAFAKKVYSQLDSSRRTIKIYSSKTDNPKDDGFDHLAAGYKVSELVERRDLMPPRGITVTSFDDSFEPVRPEWLVYPYILKGKATLLDARGGTGKSSLMLAWAAAMSKGRHPITLDAMNGRVRTLYLHKGEDTEEELQTVYLANGGTPGYIDFGGEDFMFDPSGLRRVEESIMDSGYGFVVVDPLFSFMSGVSANTNDALSVLPVVGEITRISARTGASFVDIRHMKKYNGAGGGAIQDQGLGSVQFVNAHRGQLCAYHFEGHPGIVKVEDGRGSILRATADPFYFRKVGLEVQYWHHEESDDGEF